MLWFSPRKKVKKLLVNFQISNLATKTALITVENKIPDTRGLVKKTDYNTKITELEGKISDISNLATKLH